MWRCARPGPALRTHATLHAGHPGIVVAAGSAFLGLPPVCPQVYGEVDVTRGSTRRRNVNTEVTQLAARISAQEDVHAHARANGCLCGCEWRWVESG
jgi:hypothetical protein